jgi:hypothetical protein
MALPISVKLLPVVVLCIDETWRAHSAALTQRSIDMLHPALLGWEVHFCSLELPFELER